MEMQPLPRDYKPYNPPSFWNDAKEVRERAQFWRRAIVGLALFWGSILWAVFR